MFKIVKKRELNPTVTEMVIEAPLIAKKAKAGQFIIIRAKEDSERIPLTIALPVAQALKAQGTKVTGIIGFRNKDLVILEDEFRACCDELIIMSDDGSYGQKGVVTMPLEEKIKAGANFDEVITIGPLIMMKFVVKTTKPYNVKTVVSMNPIMVDGTGMCGGCRLTVGGKTKFACVDGPDFDGFEVDFDEAMHRGTMYRDFEAHAREAECNLLKKEVE